MTTPQMFGVICVAYFAVTLAIVVFKPASVWRISKIQGFVSLLGDTGARVFIGLWGAVMGGLGLYLLL